MNRDKYSLLFSLLLRYKNSVTVNTDVIDYQTFGNHCKLWSARFPTPHPNKKKQKKPVFPVTRPIPLFGRWLLIFYMHLKNGILGPFLIVSTHPRASRHFSSHFFQQLFSFWTQAFARMRPANAQTKQNFIHANTQVSFQIAKSTSGKS